MRFGALVAVVALVVCPAAFAAQPAGAQVPMDDSSQQSLPCTSGQTLGVFVIEGLEDGSVTIAPVDPSDPTLPPGVAASVAKGVVDNFVRLDGLSYTECYEDAAYTVRCDHGPAPTPGNRRIRIQNFLYDHPSDCDLVWTNPLVQVDSVNNCHVLGSSVIAGNSPDWCGDTIHDVNDPGSNGRFDVLLNVNAHSSARFTVYVSVLGTLLTHDDCLPCS
jgi:hypothetical protein